MPIFQPSSELASYERADMLDDHPYLAIRFALVDILPLPHKQEAVGVMRDMQAGNISAHSGLARMLNLSRLGVESRVTNMLLNNPDSKLFQEPVDSN